MTPGRSLLRSLPIRLRLMMGYASILVIVLVLVSATLYRTTQASIERNTERELTNALLDIDHFKAVNDTWGHEVGDEVLRQLGHYLVRYTRGEDVQCRYGGEEFVLIMPDTGMDEAVATVERLCRRVREDLEVRTRAEAVRVILSAGVAVLPTHGSHMDAVLSAADAALYRAKESGRDRVATAEEA